MNKLILLLAMALFGCATDQPTRMALNCQAEYYLESGTMFVGGSKVKDEIGCKMIRIPIAPKAIPLEVHPELIDKNQK
jgi:hypothetical protein